MSIELHRGDATLLFPHASWADVMIVDPPYRSAVHEKATSASCKRGVRKRNMGFECITWSLRDYVATIASEVRRWSVIFSDMESVGAWKDALEARGATYVRAVSWVRWSQPQMSDDRPPSGCEMVVLAWGRQKGRKSWNGPRNLTHLAHKCLRGEDKHKAEKPLDLMLDLVSWFSDPGEVVFDPLMGSGTTGLACKVLGRSFCGVELDPAWEEHAKFRIHEHPGFTTDRDRERYERWQASRPAVDPLKV